MQFEYTKDKLKTLYHQQDQGTLSCLSTCLLHASCALLEKLIVFYSM
jgi:hypothetical protein